MFGWTAIVLLFLLGAVLGYSGSRLIGLPAALGGALGAAAVMCSLFVVDRRRSRSMRRRAKPTP